MKGSVVMRQSLQAGIAVLALFALFALYGCGVQMESLASRSDWSFKQGADALERGQYDAAIIHYTRFIQENQGKPARLAPAYNNRAAAYRAIKDRDRALSDYNQAVDLSDAENRWQYMMQRGIFLHESGSVKDALADFERVIARKPDLKSAYYYRGLCWKALNELEKAEADFLKAK
ncbi:MAG: tetratricopeptide repeat protein [Deltaproteobacteria bacterium]|nr:tetratricopeptide repeat protein [Deltaproteobacteria bacterium]